MRDYDGLKSLMDYLAASVSPFHAAAEAASALERSGFRRLDEGDAWQLEAGGAYYLLRNGSSLIAFVVGSAAPAEAGFRLLAAHTDSPGFRVKSNAETLSGNVGRLALDLYGAPIVSTWLDRELAVAGRLAVETAEGDLRSVLVDSVEPVALIPNVAIHLNRDVNKGYEYDPHAKLSALISAAAPAAAAAAADKAPGAAAPGTAAPAAAAGSTPAAVPADAFLPYLARLAGAAPAQIRGADLYLYDPAPPRRFGLEGELVAASRVDNLAGCHAALSALLESRAALPSIGETRVMALFDNEEVGSRSFQGADSSFLRLVLERVAALRSPAAHAAEAYHRAAARSLLISIDAAHALHPSWAEKYDERTSPRLNCGPALKINGRMRYATDAEGCARFESLCGRLGLPVQRFEFRADQTPGGTIGPMSAADLGIRTVDVGLPILAMHSVRESFGAADQARMILALEGALSGR